MVKTKTDYYELIAVILIVVIFAVYGFALFNGKPDVAEVSDFESNYSGDLIVAYHNITPSIIFNADEIIFASSTMNLTFDDYFVFELANVSVITFNIKNKSYTFRK